MTPATRKRKTVHYEDLNNIKTSKLTIIVAMAKRNVIGNKGVEGMLWHLPEDMQHFKKTTFENICIFGRSTFQNILEILGKPLPGRISIVLTKNKEWKCDYDNVFIVHSVREALAKARKIQKYGQKIFICGGEDVYKIFLPFADRVIATHINTDIDGTAYFPELGKEWRVDSSEEHLSKTGMSYKFVTYKKRP
ncbi:MAG: dihydrofolate reductase [Candidatus Paceibacterota bacterium]